MFLNVLLLFSKQKLKFSRYVNIKWVQTNSQSVPCAPVLTSSPWLMTQNWWDKPVSRINTNIIHHVHQKKFPCTRFWDHCSLDAGSGGPWRRWRREFACENIVIDDEEFYSDRGQAQNDGRSSSQACHQFGGEFSGCWSSEKSTIHRKAPVLTELVEDTLIDAIQTAYNST